MMRMKMAKSLFWLLENVHTNVVVTRWYRGFILKNPNIKMEHRHRKKETPAPASTHHLFVHVKSLMSANLGEELEVFFHIYDGRENRPLRGGMEGGNSVS
ncbi:Dedicator of cytokinesis protein 4 [Liparis tanakae]|uniref:Dedicator of cytokinesis protein 4 n=1 Tax=Liparis tanakae TaxID=230148 RepID=A0A4Z2HMV4_9TELE|nr:Dedicator of cytokinesis protein 4 [Liparis tanakae]